MKIRYRIFLGFIPIVGAAFYFMLSWIINDIRPHLLKGLEVMLLDTANVLAASLERQSQGGQPAVSDLRAVMDKAGRRQFTARVYEQVRTKVDLRVYVTDRRGMVLLDSEHGRDEGKDYSRWNDVRRTLRGEYGARSTRADPSDPHTSVLYVAAPVVVDGRTIGVVSVGKPSASVRQFIEESTRKVIIGGIVAGLAVIGIGFLISAWITWPVERLTAYSIAVKEMKPAKLPRLGHSEIGTLGAAFEEMRLALEGKKYIENYIQALTHELKGPLSSIVGAVELLRENPPPEQRQRFIDNISRESNRMRQMVDRLLQLALLESRRELGEMTEVDLAETVAEIAESLAPQLAGRNLALTTSAESKAKVWGDRFLIRQALANLVQNAVDFSPANGTITVIITRRGPGLTVVIADQGPGVPEYARGRVFEKFYSLPRPDGSPKSSGLGLAIVREVARLHGGETRLTNDPAGGARATLWLPG